MHHLGSLSKAHMTVVVLVAAVAVMLAWDSDPGRASTPKTATRTVAKSATKTATTKSADPCAYPATEDALVSCRKREYDRTETDLARLAATLNRNYGPDVALAGVFSKAQTKWREFRDAECKLETYDSQGGTAYESYWLECLAKLDRDRIKTLEDLRDHP